MKLQDLKNELSNEKQFTENGALGYRTTGKELLDLNFSTSSLRYMDEQEIFKKFLKAFYENKLLAVKWLFFLRDIRGNGMGERRSFRVILQNLAYTNPEIIKEMIPLIPEYGRWDDLWCLLDTDLRYEVIKFCYLTFLSDVKNCQNVRPVTLLSKWLPSISSKRDNYPRYAKALAKGFNLTQKDYSKALNLLREYSNVVECKMSNNRWSEIDFETVPSKANLLYKDAFMRHEPERRKAYLESLAKGEVKINAGTLFVHDIVHKYTNSMGWRGISAKEYDSVLEELWNALLDLSEIEEETIVVRDDSGSMMTNIDNKTTITALEVATALSIYFSQFLKGEFKDKYISFSNRPKFIDLSNCNNLKEKLDLSYAHSEISDTNIEATFNLILNTAIKNNYTQSELPKNILVISDMEFNGYCCTTTPSATLFEKIARNYAEHGYNMPRLIFWNTCGRTNTIPVKENEYGVALVSGFSQNILNMVLKGDLDPYQNLVDVLNSTRYDAVEEAFNNVKQN